MLKIAQQLVRWAPARQYHFQKVSPNMELVRAKPKGECEGANCEPTEEADDRPLVVMMPWLLAKRPHVLKYARLYTDRGIDVLAVHSNPLHLLRPVAGSQVVAGELLGYLAALPGKAPLLLHGFSVGGYLWGEALVQLSRNPADLTKLSQRFAGQVWDSAVEIGEAPAGLARSVFPQSSKLQAMLEKFLRMYLSLFQEYATCHYEQSSKLFHLQPLRCPALLLLSRSDPIGTVSANSRLLDTWKKLGIDTTVKIWDGSPHVGHFRKYKAEYEEQVHTFLVKLGLVKV